jgi:hypothetical protein
MCTIEASLAEDHDYLAAGPIGQSFNIAPAPLTVTPSSGQSMVYGSSPPANLAYDLSGFVNDETDAALRTAGDLSGQASCSADVSHTSAVDTYPITCTTGSLSATNYTFDVSAQTETFAVTPATLTVRADDQSVQYSDALPTLTYGITGFVNGEDTSVLTGALACATVAAVNQAGQVTSPAGDYPISCSGDLADDNYTIAHAAGTLSVSAEGTVVRLAQNNPHAVSVPAKGPDAGKATALTFTAESPRCVTGRTATSRWPAP